MLRRCLKTMQSAAKRCSFVFGGFYNTAIFQQFNMACRLLYLNDMAYYPRYEIIADDAFFHVTWQCHNKDWLLKEEWAKQAYYNLLLKYKDKYGVEIYSYNFMDNHPHLTGHLREKEKFSAFFRVVNSQFAMTVNKRLKRRGQVVMDRFKSPTIESDEHMLKAMAYIDLNPHRVGKVKRPEDNTWSSYQHYAYGRKDPLITVSPSYLALGETSAQREYEYREIVAALIEHRGFLNISHTHFIGDPEWVLKKYCELCNKLGKIVVNSRAGRFMSPPMSSES